MFNWDNVKQVELAADSHETADEGLCFMEMVAWFEGEAHSDKPQCACPVLGAYGIRLNDNMNGQQRNALLRPLVPLMAGTRDTASEQKRAEFLAMWAVNKVLPVILLLRGHEELALYCQTASNLDEAYAAARAAANAAANVAANAAYAAARAAADAAANVAANAAYAAARAAADAAAYTADAAYAAADAADAAYAAADAARAADEIWSIAAEGLRQAILIGRHDGFSVSADALVERHTALKQLACAV